MLKELITKGEKNNWLIFLLKDFLFNRHESG